MLISEDPPLTHHLYQSKEEITKTILKNLYLFKENSQSFLKIVPFQLDSNLAEVSCSCGLRRN